MMMYIYIYTLDCQRLIVSTLINGKLREFVLFVSFCLRETLNSFAWDAISMDSEFGACRNWMARTG